MNDEHLVSQWCQEHWDKVPLVRYQKEMAMNLIIYKWIKFRSQLMGPDFPKPWEEERINLLMNLDSPLCCLLGKEAMDEIYQDCNEDPLKEIGGFI